LFPISLLTPGAPSHSHYALWLPFR
jgi:hypothetical protein